MFWAKRWPWKKFCAVNEPPGSGCGRPEQHRRPWICRRRRAEVPRGRAHRSWTYPDVVDESRSLATACAVLCLLRLIDAPRGRGCVETRLDPCRHRSFQPGRRFTVGLGDLGSDRPEHRSLNSWLGVSPRYLAAQASGPACPNGRVTPKKPGGPTNPRGWANRPPRKPIPGPPKNGGTPRSIRC